jgi:hypothetical protein
MPTGAVQARDAMFRRHYHSLNQMLHWLLSLTPSKPSTTSETREAFTVMDVRHTLRPTAEVPPRACARW